MREKQNKNKYLRKMEFIQKMSPLSSHLIKSECRFDRKPRKKIHLSTRFRRCVRLNLDNNQNAFLSRRIEVHYFPLEIRKNFFCRSLSRKTDTKINSALNNTFVAHFIGFFSGRYLTVWKLFNTKQRLKTALLRAQLTTQVFKTCAQHSADNNSDDDYNRLAFIIHHVQCASLYIYCLFNPSSDPLRQT